MGIHHISCRATASGIDNLTSIIDAMAWLCGNEELIRIDRTTSYHGSEINLVMAKVSKNKEPEESEIRELKIFVRNLSSEDIKNRKLPNQTRGLVITKIANDSPLVDSIEVNSVILEAQKKKINSVKDLNQIVNQVLNSNQKTILLVIYNSKNERRYIGVKLD